MRNNRQSAPLSPQAPGANLLAAAPGASSTDLAPVLPVIASDAGNVDLPFAHYMWLLRTQLWKVIVFVVIAVIATAMVTVQLTPIYESTASLYVDRGAAKDIVGHDSESQAGNVVSADADAFLASQIKLLQSDSVVRPLAEKYNLLEREKQIKPSDDRDKQFRVRTAPIVLKGLRVTRSPNSYIIQIAYRSTDRDVATAVANGIAESYIEHTYDIRIRSSASLSKFMTRQLDELRAKMETSSARLAALETELNVINPEEKTNILSARLLQVNTEYTKVQADRVRAESSYNSLMGGSLDAGLASSQSQDLRAIVKRLNEAKERFSELKARYGPNHPEYERLQATVKELEAQVDATHQSLIKQAGNEYDRAKNQEALLQKDVADTKAEYDRLNQRSFEYQRAKREADADRALYEELVKKIREDEINSGFQNDMVRLADPARPGSKPVFPSIPLNLVLAFLISAFLGIIAVVMSDRIDTTIRNPEQITGGLGARVIGTLPLIKTRGAQALAAFSRGAGVLEHGNPVQLQDVELTGFEEAIRTIRNSILLTDFDRQLRSILITSAVPGEGKSTFAAHLAISHAAQGHKTLLVDGDMRRPSAHKLFDMPNTVGLSKVLDRGMSWREVVSQPRAGLDLHVLTAGPVNRRAADLVGQALPQLLEEVCEEFELVVLDAPPLLGFPEPLQMAASVDGVVIITKAGQTDRNSVAAVLNTLNELRANIIGLVLNEVRRESSRSYYYYGNNYGKYYGNRKDK